jgi:hypothetical protein
MELSKTKKAAGVYCCVHRCKDKPHKKKGGLCHKHYKRKRRKLDPIAVRYNDLVQSSKRRDRVVGFTLAEFRVWCKGNGYMSKGRRGYAATIDRRCNAQGYYFFNMVIVSSRYNASKGDKFNQSKDRFKDPNSSDICPF